MDCTHSPKKDLILSLDKSIISIIDLVKDTEKISRRAFICSIISNRLNTNQQMIKGKLTEKNQELQQDFDVLFSCSQTID